MTQLLGPIGGWFVLFFSESESGHFRPRPFFKEHKETGEVLSNLSSILAAKHSADARFPDLASSLD
jgi:hypothetical protein